MDSTLLAAVISAVGAALATAGGAVLRSRTSVRTAARLIYAELTRNSAAVMYFRQSRDWVAPTLPQAAWDEHGEIIARRRSSRSFESVLRGYAALEIAPVLADDSVDDAVRERLLREAVEWLVEAIRELGTLAKISPDRISDTTKRPEEPPVETVRQMMTQHGARTGAISLVMQDRLVALGLESSSAGRIPELTLVLPTAVIAAVSPDTDCIVYDARQQESLDRLVVARWTGQPPTGDPAVDETYEALAAVNLFGREILGRDPIAERPLIAFVHYGTDFNNAWWDGEQLVLGDGDGTLFGRFSRCPEVIGGEVWHGVAEMLRYFTWQGEHGALHVSLCDVFGQLFKQYTLDQTAEEADWVIGAGLLAPGVNGLGLRSLKSPGTAYDDDTLGKDPQPAHMDHYVRTPRDQGGIHTNSGIPNLAFYLAAERLRGKAWENAGQIWWDALTGDSLNEGLLFADWARLTVEAARARRGSDSIEYQAVLDAWHRVGVHVAG